MFYNCCDFMSIQCSKFGRNFEDFEEELEQFSTRKQSDTKTAMNILTTQIGQNISVQRTTFHDQIPLLICDVLKIVENKIGIQFKNCLLHARVVSRSNFSNKYYKYIIDDSTESIEIRIPRRQSDLEKILRLEAEVESLKIVSAAQNKLEISGCLQRLLAKAKHELNFTNIPIGSKILVHGKPFVFRGKVAIDVFSLFCNQHIENLEIEYKDLLIEWYSEEY